MSQAPKSVVQYHENFSYTHTQRGKVIVIAMLLPMFVSFWGAFTIPSQHNTLLVVGSVAAVIAGLFSSLTVRVSDRFLHWQFGFGLIRKRVVLAQIQHYEIVRTTIIDGWGIHYTRRGWLYNVSGFDAIAFTLKDDKRFLLGSDDVQTLYKALEKYIPKA
ncbi:hypothetical protein [Uliginosibacterium gangwonense]|uniref:hypothetical protein n=1 Tax=Uliginosibacterium gangwonense TaxID=392736 RepID=UPI0012FCD842|nr:hypothetical protein [Uliginosibacterium gangwonense]